MNLILKQTVPNLQIPSSQNHCITIATPMAIYSATSLSLWWNKTRWGDTALTLPPGCPPWAPDTGPLGRWNVLTLIYIPCAGKVSSVNTHSAISCIVRFRCRCRRWNWDKAAESLCLMSKYGVIDCVIRGPFYKVLRQQYCSPYYKLSLIQWKF